MIMIRKRARILTTNRKLLLLNKESNNRNKTNINEREMIADPNIILPKLK